MAVKRITVALTLATLLAGSILMISFYSIYQPEILGKSIILNSSVQIPKNKYFRNHDPYAFPNSEIIWDGNKVIEIIEPSAERTIRE